MPEFIFEHSALLLLLCPLIGLAYALILQYKSKQFLEFSKPLRYGLFGLRFLSVTALAILLFGPVIKYTSLDVDKPIIAFVQDNSQSIKTNKFGAEYQTAYPKAVEKVLSEIKKNFELKEFGFGESLYDTLKFDFGDKQTDLDLVFKELETKYSGRNLGAVILATDGIYNKGAIPNYSAERLKCPIYTIGMGDTSIRKDIFINHISCNKIAFLNNSFPLEVIVDANLCANENASLSLYKGSELVSSQVLAINANTFSKTVKFSLDAKQVGMQHYTLKASEIKGEVTLVNNVADVFVEVVDSKEKVLLLADAPHPDLGALKTLLETNPNYQVETALINAFNKPLTAYSLVVLHQLPSTKMPIADILNELKSKQIGTWFVLGNNTNLSAFNNLGLGLTVLGGKANANDAQPIINSNFTLFTFSEDLKNKTTLFPPLATPYGTYTVGNGVFPLFNQKIGSVTTNNPLWAFSNVGGYKVAVTLGEGFWKWKLADYELHNNTNICNELVNKTAQYVSLKLNRSNFKINCNNRFDENESIILDAEFYNDAFEPINNPELNFTLTNTAGKEYKYVFNKTEKAYQLGLGKLPVGNYNFKGSIVHNGKTYTAGGSFIVSPIYVELTNITANHSLLRNLSKNGAFYLANNFSGLPQHILANPQIKPVSFVNKKLEDIINFKWVLPFIILLLALEWFLKKRNGGY